VPTGKLHKSKQCTASNISIGPHDVYAWCSVWLSSQ